MIFNDPFNLKFNVSQVQNVYLGSGLMWPVLWTFENPVSGKTITNIRIQYAQTSGESVFIDWGDGIEQLINNNTLYSHTYASEAKSVKLKLLNYPQITSFDIGANNFPLSGRINISALTQLRSLVCSQNGITAVDGYQNNINLTGIRFNNNSVTGLIRNLSNKPELNTFWCFRNKLTGIIPNLNSNINLKDFRCNNNSLVGEIPILNNPGLRFFNCEFNQLTGVIPNLNNNIELYDFRCHGNQLTGPIPSLSGLNKLEFFYCNANNLTGSIPSLSQFTNSRLRFFNCGSNQLTGPIPSLSSLSILNHFVCSQNQLTGNIPNISTNSTLTLFECPTNQLTGFAGGSVSNTLGNFQAQGNQLTSTAVNAILAAFVAANRTSGTRILNLGGAGNAPPTGQGITDKNTLISRGWTVTTN